jgi:hypothetical protein
MYTITINHRKSPVTYDILTSEEALNDNIQFKYWREAYAGDYAVSDDDIVAKLIKRTSYKNGSTYFRFPWGYCICKDVNKSFKLLAENRESKYTFSGKPWLKVHKKQLLGDMAMVYAMTHDKNKTIETVHGKDVKDSNKRKYKRWMKSEVFTDMVREEHQKLLQKHSMDEDFTMELLKNAIDIAKDKKDVSNMLKAVDNLQEMHGMKDKATVKTTEHIEASETHKMLESLEEEERRLSITQTKEVNGIRESQISKELEEAKEAEAN